MTALIEVKNLKKYFKVGRKRYLTAVDDVSFEIQKGRTVGLVGESGCGKTTCGKTIMGLLKPTEGQILYDGVDTTNQTRAERLQFTRKAQIIFQDPYASLNPRMTVSDIVGEGIAIHNLYTGIEKDERIHELIELVGLNAEHASRFPHEFSGGQRQRIGIARALAVDPEFLVLDEPISALDVSIQAQIINLLIELQKTRGLTYLFIAHDLSVVRHISDYVGVMYLGQMIEFAECEKLFDNPTHPYTQALLSAIPVADPEYEKKKERHVISGEVSSPINPKPGCRFANRCPYVMDRCHHETPALVEIEEGHQCACFLLHDVASGMEIDEQFPRKTKQQMEVN